ncbi:MAG: hypothetical protein Fur0032_17130 [Terrimicrobiaceae bacterium]
MKTALMLREWTWWVWLVTVLLLGTGLAGFHAGFAAAIGLSFGQTVYFRWRRGSWGESGVQIRLAYTLLLVACFWHPLRWLYWLPTLGTVALLLFGYCLMARMLSLLPWNRQENLSLDLVRRTFLTPPRSQDTVRAMRGCGQEGGVCELEARIAAR